VKLCIVLSFLVLLFAFSRLAKKKRIDLRERRQKILKRLRRE